jgi:hypothetical protein
MSTVTSEKKESIKSPITIGWYSMKVITKYLPQRMMTLSLLKLSQLRWKYFISPLNLLSTVENSCVTPSWVKSMCRVLMSQATVLTFSLIT